MRRGRGGKKEVGSFLFRANRVRRMDIVNNTQ